MMNYPCKIIVNINGANVPAIVDPSKYFSIVSTGFLETFNIKCNNVKFMQRQITFSARVPRECVKILGKIKKFEFSLEFVLLRHDVYIIDDNIPALLLGQDWIDKYEIQEELRDNMTELNKSDPESETTSEIIDEDIIGKSEELLIDFTKFDEKFEDESTSSICTDVLELDTLIFQQDFNPWSLTPPSVTCSESLFTEMDIEQKEITLAPDPFSQLNPELIIKICELLTIGDLNNLAQTNKLLRKYALLTKSDRKRQISQEPYYSDIGRNFLNPDQSHRFIHLAPELTGEEATRHLRNTPKLFYTQADHARFFQNKRDWSRGNQSIEEIPQEKDYNVKPSKQSKCYICKRRGYTMKSCNLEPTFREHERYCKQYNVHVWKSWKLPEESKLRPKGTYF